MITHTAIAHHCRDCQRYYEITPQDHALQFASLNFDASLEQIFTALIAGARLVLRGPDILDARRFNEMVAANALTIVNIPPAYWHQWAQACADGNIEFLGRLDNQIKIRGIRIEPGEIDAALQQHPKVRDGIVIARQNANGEKYLVAYVVAPDERERPAINELRDFLRAKLPDYMLPSAFVFLDALPLNVSGKVDHRALPVPDRGRPERAAAYVAPRTFVEEELAHIWVDLLKVERVGIHANFFNLGGYSLLATQLASRIRDAFQVELPLRSFFESATIADLSVLIAQQIAQSNDTEIDHILGEIEALNDDQVQANLSSETH